MRGPLATHTYTIETKLCSLKDSHSSTDQDEEDENIGKSAEQDDQPPLSQVSSLLPLFQVCYLLLHRPQGTHSPTSSLLWRDLVLSNGLFAEVYGLCLLQKTLWGISENSIPPYHVGMNYGTGFNSQSLKVIPHSCHD